MSTMSLSTGLRPPAQAARTRQIVYALAIVVLFAVMWPYTEWLQARKQRAEMGEATIGQVDAGSFMLKLAMIGGARGIVANALWTRAMDLQKAHEWDKLMTTINFITQLQPHFLSIWTFQGWNLAYNVSVEWDAPDDKYTWIKKGINFLKEGVAKNRRTPDLIWDTAWTYYHKLGFADEAILLRRLFYDDPDDDDSAPRFKVDPIEQVTRHDNFQVAHGWFVRSVRKVDEEGGLNPETVALKLSLDYVDPQKQHKGQPGDLAFRSMPAHAQTRYALALEKMSIKDLPATFGEIARNEWTRSLNEWVAFGRYKFETPNVVRVDGRLVTQPVYIDDATDPKKKETLHENQWHWSDRWAHQMNYPYWKDRSAAEAERDGVEARRSFYEGLQALRAADYPRAVERYRQGLVLWKKVMDRHAGLAGDMMNQKDTGHLVKRYVFALRQVGEPVPKDLPFKKMYESVKDDHSVDPFDQMEVTRSTPKATPATPR